MKLSSVILVSLLALSGYGQTSKKADLFKKALKSACGCIDTVSTSTGVEATNVAINQCMQTQVMLFNLMDELDSAMVKSLSGREDSAGMKRNLNISLNENSASARYWYRELRAALVRDCPSMKKKMATNDESHMYSYSMNSKAIEWYNKGMKEGEKEHLKKAEEYYRQALKVDPMFAFAWDNLGLIYRKMKEYDQALDCYNRSMQIDPLGKTPLQNSAIVYQYQGKYQESLEMYVKLAALDTTNPEVYYGIGAIYAQALKKPEQALDNLCHAYNLYIEQQSPYRTDAEKLISVVYHQMKEANQEKKFREILKKYNIRTE